MHRFSSEDGVRRKRKKENRREMREGREWGRHPNPQPLPLGHFTFTQFLLGPFSHGQTLPATARTQATMKEESKMALEQCCITV